MARYSMHAVLVLVLLTFQVGAEKPFRYPEGKHGKGELKYVNGVPVLVVAGKPEEIGEQIGTLAVKHAPQMIDAIKAQVRTHVGDAGLNIAAKFSRGLFKNVPEEYRKEVEAMAKAGGVDLELLFMANTVFDLKGIRVQGLFGCAGLVVEPLRSKTGGPLLGRNVDTDPLGGIHEAGLVIVYRPEGKQPFVIVTFPGLLACMCGMNASGLAVGCDDSSAAADKSPSFDPTGVISPVAQRRVIEKCRTLAEMEKWLRDNPIAIYGIIPACDLRSAAVFEVTPKTVVVRKPDQGIVCATNHFLSAKLHVDIPCPRLPELEKARQLDKLSVADVAARMHAANAGRRTIHTMVFEPKVLKLHVAFGDGKKSATEFPLKELDLKELMKP